MIKVDCGYNIKEDIRFFLESERMNLSDLAEKTKISRTTLDGIMKKGRSADSVCEKFYTYVYENRYRMNIVKEELIREKYQDVLFHGSKNGLSEITVTGSRDRCDFGQGFYLGENYSQALAFVCENEKSSVYSFKYSVDNLKVKRFACSLEWMLAICCYRGTLGDFTQSKMVRQIIAETEDSDVIIAPIADNKMFYIMAQFTDGEINADVALHSLSASSLGSQYVFRSEKALKKLVPIEKYYLCRPEREECKARLNERSYEIDTKLKLAKREFKNGLYIEEILK